jgi:hypothetical protein
MALSLQLGFPDVPKSITNPNVFKNDTLDVEFPMSFLTFIKLINVSFEPDSLQNYYNFYIKSWNNLNSSKELNSRQLILEKYREFLKELSLKYTTLEEQAFLSKIDFNDPYDLDIVMGFYSKKLKDLATFYNNKRHDIKFNIVRNKLIGTTYGSEKTILELVLSYLKTLDDGKILFDYDEITKKIEVELEELYDTYPLYLNQTPNSLIYDNKNLDYGYNIFLVPDDITISTLLSGFSTELQELKEFPDLLENKRKLTQKYVSTNFYYLSTGNTTEAFLSGKLFSCDNEVLNLINRDYPTTASTQNPDFLVNEQSLGFFRPHKQSIILLDGENESYSFNFENLAPNTIYLFPDPNKIGENGDVITFIINESNLKKNYSSGNAKNQPYSSKDDTKYYGYTSKLELPDSKYLDVLFDQGFISDIKQDIYSNLFGLFKDDHRYRQHVEPCIDDTVNTPYSVVINGHLFYDTFYNEGYSFDYFISDDTYPSDIKYNETLRTGLSTTTAKFTNSLIDLTMFFGYFTPYMELSIPTEGNLTPTYEILEGGFITNYDYSLYNDALPSDLSAFEIPFTQGLSSFYYDTLVDGGIYSDSPLQRALLDPSFPSISANLTKSTKTSALEIVDGGYLGTYFPPSDTLPDNYIYLNTTNSPTEYILSSYPVINGYDLNGKIFIRSSSDKSVNSLLNTLPYLTIKYNSNILQELNNNVIRFEVIYDVLCMETKSYFTINKLLYVNGKFIDPKTISYYITHSTNDYNKISNRFKKDFDIYYYTTKLFETYNNNLVIYPEIYRFDTINFKNYKIFPKTNSDIENNLSFFTISSQNIRYVKVDTPTLTYSSRNNVFNMSFLIKDQNDMFEIHEIDFYTNPNVEFLSHKRNTVNISNYSNILSSLDNLNLFLSSGSIIINGEELSI